jgi:hypothetical protein
MTHSEGINPLELQGTVEAIAITDGLAAASGGFEKI